MNRRHLLRATALAVPAIALGACTVTTANGVTTITVNTQLAVAYASGLAALASALVGLPGLSVAIGASLPAVEAAIADVNAAVPAINSAAGGSASFSFNTTSAPAFIASLLADAASLKNDATAAVTALGSSVPTNVTTYYDGLVSVANAVAALFSLNAGAVASPMPVEQALALVHIEVPA
jgi:hypothetical protein